jgi:hypothetical protein
MINLEVIIPQLNNKIHLLQKKLLLKKEKFRGVIPHRKKILIKNLE